MACLYEGEKTMYAIVISRQYHPGKLGEVIQLWQDKVAPVLKQQQGFKAAYMVGDRSTGKGEVITLWEGEAAASAWAASDQQKQIVQMLEPYRMTPPTRALYEVFAQA
jgi:heme-degrading monooxygenase HmoA